jgi:hypothetical protein
MRREPLTSTEREQLFQDLTDWYYDDGHGMLLSEETRNIYLKAKENLTCAVDDIEPELLRTRLLAAREQLRATGGSQEEIVRQLDLLRGDASIRQLSLLRTSMRGDIAIYTSPYGHDLNPEDKAFLEACGGDPSRPPWRVRKQRPAIGSVD